jgi:tyrosyl-tRNA synthetase
MKKSVVTDKERVDEVLGRGVAEIIDQEHLRRRMLAGEKLRIKFGIDPTSPYLHLGHTVPLRKLRQLQDLGHQAVLIIGDATAMIGDPTGRSEARKQLTKKEVAQNAKTYLKQAGKILDLKKLEVRHNGGWFFPMSAADWLGLTSLVTLQQVLQREDFKKRVDDPVNPLSVLEINYPLMQGYDSVQVKADLEIGGVDQKLNLLMGRRMQRRHEQPEQDIMTVPLIEGTDGERKMSKSFGNAILLTATPEDMYALVMSITDNVISRYFELLTDVPLAEIKKMEAGMKRGDNPRDIKAKLAFQITKTYHDEKKARAAAESFDRQFKKKELPEEIQEFSIVKESNVVEVLVNSGLAASKSEARRLIDGGGIKVDGHAIEGYDVMVYPSEKAIIIQKGKRHFRRIVKI